MLVLVLVLRLRWLLFMRLGRLRGGRVGGLAGVFLKGELLFVALAAETTGGRISVAPRSIASVSSGNQDTSRGRARGAQGDEKSRVMRTRRSRIRWSTAVAGSRAAARRCRSHPFRRPSCFSSLSSSLTSPLRSRPSLRFAPVRGAATVPKLSQHTTGLLDVGGPFLVTESIFIFPETSRPAS